MSIRAPGAAVAAALLAGGALAASGAAAQQAPSGGDSTAAQIQALKRQLEVQRRQMMRQLDEQQRQMQQQIKALQDQLDAVKGQAAETQRSAADAVGRLDASRKEAAETPLVTSSSPRVKVAISGQVDRIVNGVADGHKAKAYFADNDVNESRFRLEGTVKATDDVTIGSAVEVGVSPNNSENVSQDDESPGDAFDQRVVEGWVRSERLGKLTLGKGSGAADNTAEYNNSALSGVIMYAEVSDPVGGIRFRRGKELSGTSLADAFFDFDGDRHNRVRYDTPALGPGVQLSASAGENQRWDLAANWGGNYDSYSGVAVGDFTTLAAVAISDPNEGGVRLRYDGSVSVLHNPTGVSLTLAGGGDDVTRGDDPYMAYAMLAWDKELNRFGVTSLGVDFYKGGNREGDGNDSYSAGLAALQSFKDWGVDVFGQIRWLRLDERDGPSLDDVYALTVGTRLKF